MPKQFVSSNGTVWLMNDPVADYDKSNVISMPVRKFEHRGTAYTIVACAYLTYPLRLFYSLQVRNSKGVKFPASTDRDFRVLKKMMSRDPIDFEQYLVTKQKLHRKLVEKKLEMHKVDGSQNMQATVIEESGNTFPSQSSFAQEWVCTKSAIETAEALAGVPNDSLEQLNKAMEDRLTDKLEGWCVHIARGLKRDGRYPSSYFHTVPYMMNKFLGPYVRGEINSRRKWLRYVSGALESGLSATADKMLKQSMQQIQWQTKNIYGCTATEITDDDDDLIEDEDDDAFFGDILGIYCRSEIHGNYSGCVNIVDQRQCT